MTDEELARAEVLRVVEETRGALGLMATEMRLAYPLMGICSLIDRVKIGVTMEEGDGAFVLGAARAIRLHRYAESIDNWLCRSNGKALTNHPPQHVVDSSLADTRPEC